MATEDRPAVLNSYFARLARGKWPTLTRENSRCILDAICIKEPTVVLQTFIAQPLALEAFQRALLIKTDAVRLNGRTARAIVHLQDPSLRTIGGGALLSKVVARIARPPTLLLAYKDALLAKKLVSLNGQKAYSWLLLQCSSLPAEPHDGFDLLIETCLDTLLASPHPSVQTTAQALQRAASGVSLKRDGRAGGKHNNDCEDFRSIAILPTSGELQCDEAPYMLTPLELEDIPTSDRAKAFIENQFRLLREDMLFALREEIDQLSVKRKSHCLSFERLELVGVFGIQYDNRGHARAHKWCLQLQCTDELACLRDVHVDDREQHLWDQRSILRHQSSMCLIVDGEPIAFPVIHRDVERLARDPAVICLQFDGKLATSQALLSLKMGHNIQLVQLETAIFAYEPVLKSLQNMSLPALTPELFEWDDTSVLYPPPVTPDHVIETLQDNPQQDLGALLNMGRVIVLDPAQRLALLSALGQRVALIQGPPGCGKSFVGALIAKILYEKTNQTILISCFTNHALDQFLEDLLDNGIPESAMVRLGGKSTTRTAPLSLYSQARTHRFNKYDWQIIETMQSQARAQLLKVEACFAAFQAGVSDADLLKYLESKTSLAAFADAFSVASISSDDDMVLVGANGRDVNASYLLTRWTAGKDAGVFAHQLQREAIAGVWRMPLVERCKELCKWRDTLLLDKALRVFQAGERYNATQAELEQKFSEGSRGVLLNKRIIACTTTGAAKYTQWLQKVSPEVLLVEEAGEILESHVLAALGAKTKHMILIGDHQQLRPKVNNYSLTVESGGGYELNVSLFERLVLSGYPHHTLKKQHRMRPEISSYPRRLTYPDLLDDTSTFGRPDVLGIRDNIVFIAHQVPENDTSEGVDASLGLRSSKRNTFEVEMVLKTVRYLLQQGYDTNDLVVLTPYLGQLQKIREMMLLEDHNPLVGDLDSGELQRAGITFGITDETPKKSIRLATIDNYQGEESDIVIASFVRSNASHDIGFMSSPERLNVLLSRARNALIMIGNPDTFMKSRSGKSLYSRFFSYLKEDGHIYEGLPIQCARHTDQKTDLITPADFGDRAPHGGCLKPCNEFLGCGTHVCPSKCHHPKDHSRVMCQYMMDDTCPSGHRRRRRCFEGMRSTCKECDQAAELARERRERLEAKEHEFDRRMAELGAEMEILRMDERAKAVR